MKKPRKKMKNLKGNWLSKVARKMRKKTKMKSTTPKETRSHKITLIILQKKEAKINQIIQVKKTTKIPLTNQAINNEIKLKCCPLEIDMTRLIWVANIYSMECDAMKIFY